VIPKAVNQGPELAEGRACVYCGGPAPMSGHLIPLRPSVRAAFLSDIAPGRAALGLLFPDIMVRRCEPPCPAARRAYREGFHD
jgi:hypothetical protein